VLQRTHVWADRSYPDYNEVTCVKSCDATEIDLVEFAMEKGNPLLIEIEVST
jgi:hypothetical protein